MSRSPGFFVRLARRFAASLLFLAVAGCGSGGSGDGGGTSASGGGGAGGNVAGVTPPAVTSFLPVNLDFNAAVNRKLIATFSKPMNPASINAATFTVKTFAGASVAGAVTLDQTNNIAIFTPTALLASNTQFLVTISTGAQDLAGNGLSQDKTWTFFTVTTTDVAAPTIAGVNPPPSAAGVGINKTVNITFSEPMDSSTITTANFLLTGPGATPVTGAVRYDSVYNIATFTPTSNLAASTQFTESLTAGVKDLAGNSLAPISATFTTGTLAVGQAPVVLGTASTFAVLAGTGVANTGASTISGDLGVNPGTVVTGFPPGMVLGSRHSGDAAAAQAQLDLTAAVTDAAARATGVQIVAGDLGSQTLNPGLYRSNSTLAISSGNLTLDAQGDASAVFIFQVATNLTVGGRQVILTGGTRAANVFWQVGNSATLGTNSAFQGTILADQSITLASGVALVGRALTRNGAVIVDSAAVSTPVP